MPDSQRQGASNIIRLLCANKIIPFFGASRPDPNFPLKVFSPEISQQNANEKIVWTFQMSKFFSGKNF
jgi:hypothetical protein